MKILFQGCQFTMQNPTDNMWNLLFQNGPQQFYFLGRNRILHLDTETDNIFHLGVLVTIKDQKSFCELKAASPSSALDYVLVNTKIETKASDFNFFIVNKKTRRGLYQYYHNSTALTHFCDAMRERFIFHRRRLEETATETQRAEMVKSILCGEPMMKPEAFLLLVNQLSSITEIKYSSSFMGVEETPYESIKNKVKRHEARFTFERVDTSDLFGDIKKLFAKIKNYPGLKLKIKGHKPPNKDGISLEDVVDLSRNLSDFGKFEYDDLIHPGDQIILRDISTSNIIHLLLEQAVKEPIIMEVLENDS